jgi:6-phosphogluconolactonase (cycloisomerase 2 family)
MDGTGTGLSVVPGGEVRAAAPSFAIADLPLIFAVHELPEGAVSSYRLSDDGELEPVSTQPTGGVWPCHLALHDGHLLVANYGSGSVAVLPVDADGVIGERTDLVQHEGRGPDAERQEGPHTHQVVIAPDGTITVVDLGIDQLVHYRLAGGKLQRTGAISVPAGAGPRHYVVHPSGRWYVAAELGSAVLTISDGEFVASTPATTSDVHNQPSAVALSGDHLYIANRGADTVSAFRVGEELTLVSEVSCGGSWPRDMVIDGDLLYVANQKSNNVVTFRIGEDGTPVPTGDVIETGSPTSVLPLA